MDSTEKVKSSFKKDKWFFSFGAVGHDMVYSLVVSYLLTYIQFGFRLSVPQYLVISFAIGVLGRIWDAITDPIMGWLIQKCNFKSGKYRFWILLGAILTGMLTVFLFNANFEGWTFVIYIVTMNLLWETAYTINDISYWSMFPSISSDSKERNIISTLTLFFAGVGGGIIQGLVTIFQTGNILETYSALSIISAFAIIFTQGITALFVKEKNRSFDTSEEKTSIGGLFKTIFGNKQLLIVALALGLYVIGNGVFVSLLYNIYYIELGYDGQIVLVLVVFAIFSTLVQFLYPLLAKKMSRKKILTISSFCSITGYFLFLIIGWNKFLPFNLITICVAGFLIYTGNGLVNLITIIQITNCVEYNEFLTGHRNEAIISTVRPFVTKMSTAIKYGLTSLILIASGVFSLSQNISNLEVQKNYFSKITEYDQMSKFEIQKTYLSAIQYYSNRLDNIEDEKEYEDEIEAINEELFSNELLSSFKLEAETIQSCSTLYVLENGKVVSQIINFDVGSMEEDKNYSLSISGYYTDENGKRIKYNAGDLCFKDISTDKERIALRALSTIVPMICIALNWFIQYKYYKIDENYYEKIIKTIAEKNK